MICPQGPAERDLDGQPAHLEGLSQGVCGGEAAAPRDTCSRNGNTDFWEDTGQRALSREESNVNLSPTACATPSEGTGL